MENQVPGYQSPRALQQIRTSQSDQHFSQSERHNSARQPIRTSQFDQHVSQSERHNSALQLIRTSQFSTSANQNVTIQHLSQSERHSSISTSANQNVTIQHFSQSERQNSAPQPIRTSQLSVRAKNPKSGRHGFFQRLQAWQRSERSVDSEQNLPTKSWRTFADDGPYKLHKGGKFTII